MAQLRPMANGIDHLAPDSSITDKPIPAQVRSIVLSDVLVHPAKWRNDRIRTKCLNIVSDFCWSPLDSEQDAPPTPPIAVPLPEVIPEPALEEIFSPDLAPFDDSNPPVSAGPLALEPYPSTSDEAAARWQFRQRAQINYEIKMSRIGIPARTITPSRREAARNRAVEDRAEVVITYKRRKRTRRSPEPKDVVYDFDGML